MELFWWGFGAGVAFVFSMSALVVALLYYRGEM